MAKKDEKVEEVLETPPTEIKEETPKKEASKEKEAPKKEASVEKKENKKVPKPKKLVESEEDNVIKVDLREQKGKQVEAQTEPATEEKPVEEPPVEDKTEENLEVVEEVKEEEEETESGLELVEDTEEEVSEEKEIKSSEEEKVVEEELKEDTDDVNNKVETPELPENVNKLIDFMKDTGGTLEDYVKLNKDYDKLEDMEILREHYRQSKSHLTEDEISFLIEDSFSYNEEEDEERDIRRKKLKLKESIAEAKSNLKNLKSTYYDDLKLSSKLTPEQREAVKFYNDYKEEQKTSQEATQKMRSIFEKKTNNLFNNEFKGFEYKVGEKKYRFKVKDANVIKENQSDINKLVNKFVNKNNEMEDAPGYHKAIFTAMNADSIANHFYEQGRADAIKESMAKSKNVDMNPRGTHEAVTTSGGFRVRAVSGEDSSKLRIKIRK